MAQLFVLIALVAACRDAPPAAPREPSEHALREELLALADEDQRARASLQPDANGVLIGHGNTVEDVDRKTTARMKQVVATYGWPGRTLVGEDGAHAAWLLVQHADADLAFQTDCLARMERMLPAREVSSIDFAHLFDRVALHAGRKQRYGTQYIDGREPQPIEDPANIDARRRSVGLPTLAEGKREMLEKYGAP